MPFSTSQRPVEARRVEDFDVLLSQEVQRWQDGYCFYFYRCLYCEQIVEVDYRYYN